MQIVPSYHHLNLQPAALQVVDCMAEIIRHQQTIINDLNEQAAKGESRILELEHQNDDLRRMIMGSKSERFVASKNEPPYVAGTLFSPESLEPSTPAEATVVTITKTIQANDNKKATHPGRNKFPAHLRREQILIEPGIDTTKLVCIGQDITEALEAIPGSLFVKQYIRPRYVVPGSDGSTVIAAKMPERFIDKGIMGEGLLAQVIIDKYCDHMPLYRQARRFEREGVSLAESTLGDAVRQVANQAISPLFDLLVKQLLNCQYMQADETHIRVLAKDDANASTRGFYWVYYSPELKVAVFTYHPGRGREGPEKMLSAFKGHLQVDGYKVYEHYGGKNGIVLFHCWAHARRYFEKALQSDSERSQYALEQIQILYGIERSIEENKLTEQESFRLRISKAVPVLLEFKQWLTQQAMAPDYLPKSPIGKAINYTLERWEGLMMYCSNAAFKIDNNPIENKIRPVALGRKNYLFAGSDDAAMRAGMIYSLIATCKVNNVNPFEWLKDILCRIKSHPINRLNELMPQNWQPQPPATDQTARAILAP